LIFYNVNIMNSNEITAIRVSCNCKLSTRLRTRLSDAVLDDFIRAYFRAKLAR